ncbi:MAG: bi-domain-containing oxidoreductase [Cyclobacteriaceae bacterium]|nr:bi-domain-containing oxidoreductase [Cyclobacteriaceae bacterium]
MKQLIQSLKNGVTTLEEVPVPTPGPGQVLIQTTCSLVSLGTERMLVEFGKASLIQKARQQPEKVQQVLDKIKSEGLLPTLEAVFNKLDQPIPLGYCQVGRVVELGEGVTEYQIGERVVSNGPHAEFVCVGKNLTARIPDAVSDDEAAFAVIGSIGLQGLRLAQPSLGESVVIVGLGLIGLLTAQLAKAQGCRVFAYDVDSSKVDLANKLGIQSFNSTSINPVYFVQDQTRGHGADAVIITAATKSSDIIHEAAQLSRKRGRIVLVGVIGLELKRNDFYEKELTFQVSCSYGPGRYDENYEQKGQDYPLPFVRWTAQRNFSTILETIESKSIDVQSLISEKVPFTEFEKIYGTLKDTHRIASLMTYPSDKIERQRKILFSQPSQSINKIGISVVGSGNFTKATLLPNLKKNGVLVRGIISANGLSGTLMAKKYGALFSSTDFNDVLSDRETNLVIITTRHSLHSSMILDALKAKKNIFVEKPLVVNREELDEVVNTYLSERQLLHVGFNRRFSPHIQKIKSLLGDKPGPMHLILTMNAGYLPSNHWTLDPNEGGRIVGEACHLVDLGVHLTGSHVKSVVGQSVRPQTSNSENASFLLEMENGSNVIVNYFANGSKAYSKERLEIFYQHRTLIMDNFRETKAYGWKGFSHLKTSLDKGHAHQIHYLLGAFQEGKSLIPFGDIVNVTTTTFAMMESLRSNSRIEVLAP